MESTDANQADGMDPAESRTQGTDDRSADVAARLPSEWRYVDDSKIAKAIREDYHLNGSKKVVVLAQLANDNWRVSSKMAFGERRRIDRASKADALDALVEATYLYEASQVVRDEIDDTEKRRGWGEYIRARWRRLEKADLAGDPDLDGEDGTEQSALSAYPPLGIEA